MSSAEVNNNHHLSTHGSNSPPCPAESFQGGAEGPAGKLHFQVTAGRIAVFVPFLSVLGAVVTLGVICAQSDQPRPEFLLGIAVLAVSGPLLFMWFMHSERKYQLALEAARSFQARIAHQDHHARERDAAASGSAERAYAAAQAQSEREQERLCKLMTTHLSEFGRREERVLEALDKALATTNQATAALGSVLNSIDVSEDVEDKSQVPGEPRAPR